MTSKIKVVILYLWLGGKDKRIKGEREMEREFIFKDGKFFEVKEREEIDKMEEILEEMEWISEMFDKIDDKTVKEKKNEENL